MKLRYAKFTEELIEARGLKISELAGQIGAKPEQLYDFLRGEHVPNAALAKAIEKALGINLDPSYYGWGNPRKP